MDNDFSAIERLVAFGLEASFASQMVNSMNDMMSKMLIPSSMNTYNSTGENYKAYTKYWFVQFEGKPVGPIDEKELMSMLLNKKVNKDSHVWSAGMSEWKRIEDVPEVLKLIMLLPPEL